MTILSVSEARERILSQFKPVQKENVHLTDSLNRVLAEDIHAADDLPLFDNSSMDGFAVRAADVADASPDSPRSLRVVADIPAGSAPTVSLAPGQAARIMTGAQIPEGVDAVVPVEDTNFHDRSSGTAAPEQVQVFRGIKQGGNVRPRGMDIRAGDVVLRSGRQMKPQDVGLLAMLGISNLPVYRRAQIALLSSGDELIDIDAPLQEGKIRESNSYMIAALIENTGAEVIRVGVAKDNYESVKALFEKAAGRNVDLILSSAGVSVGAYDYVKEVIESNGKMDFWRVNMRPGKPVAFGHYRNIPVIGLPGNPVSAYVSFEVFVHATIGRLSGMSGASRATVRVRCEEQIDSDGRESYLRAEVHDENGILVGRLTGHQGSGNLHSLVRANALLIIPAGVKCVPAGQEVTAWLL